MKDEREQEACVNVMEDSISVVECVLDLVHTVEELEKNQAPKALPTSYKSDVMLKAVSQQRQSIPTLVDYPAENQEEQDQQDREVKEKLTRRETECSVNNLHLLYEEVNAVLSEILENVTPALPEENVSKQSDSILQNDGGECNLSKCNESDNLKCQQTEEEKVECPLDGLRFLLKTVPQFKLPVPEPSLPSPSVTLENQEDEEEIEAEQEVKKPVDYLQVLRILRPPPPPPKKTENTEEGEMECMSDGPNGNEEEEALTVRKKVRSVVGSTDLSPVKVQETVENGEDRDSTNSNSTIFMSKTLGQLKKDHSEKVLEAYTSISTDSESEAITKQKKEKAAKKEKARPLASTKKPLLLTNPVIIISRCDDLVRLSGKRKRSESHSSASQPSPEKAEVGKDRSCTTSPPHATVFISSVLQKLRKNHFPKVIPASVTLINKESETGAARKQKKEEPMKKRIKRDDVDTSSNSTILLSKERLMQKDDEKEIFPSESNGSDFRTFVVLEKKIKQNGKKAKSAKKKVKGAEKRRKVCDEVLDGKDNSNTSSESLFSIVTPAKSSVTDKDRASESNSTNTSKFLFSPVKKKKPSRVPAMEIKTEAEKLDRKKTLMTVRSRSISVSNKEEHETVERIETKGKEHKGEGSTKVEDTSSRSKKGKESVAGQKRKRSSSPVPSSSAENSDEALIKKWSLKPCYVVLRRDSIDLRENSSLNKGTTKTELSVEPEVINGNEDKSSVMYPCPICLRTFANSAKLDKHLKKKHFTPASQKRPEEKEVHDCLVCGKVFQYASAKQIHVANHFTTTLFRCSICKKGFPLQKGLQLHMRMKHAEKVK